MGKLRATVDLVYPTPAALKIVTAAGGVSKLTPEQREKVAFKTVAAGKFCDDLPAISRDALIAGGQVVLVGAKKGAKT